MSLAICLINFLFGLARYNINSIRIGDSMKLISITIIVALAIFILLKINIGGASETEIKKNLNPIQTREIKCAVPVNGVIYGNLPPCDMFSDSKSYNNLKKEYYVDGVVY